MEVIFSAKSNEAYLFKVLAELLQTNIPTACFEITKKGIKSRMTDDKKNILFDINLPASNFFSYKFKVKAPENKNKKKKKEDVEERLFLGINTTHFYKTLKSTKKKDSIELYIEEGSKEPLQLAIRLIPVDSNRVSTSWISIQNVQNVEIELPDCYTESTIINTTEYQKAIKSLSQTSTTTSIKKIKSIISFKADDGVVKKAVEFGQEDKEDTYSYEDDFDTEKLAKIAKLSGLSKTSQIFTAVNKPILFQTSIGSLGSMSIYIKSKNLIEAESKIMEEDEE